MQVQAVDQAKILIYKAQGASNTAIEECIDVKTVKLCLKKFKEGGANLTLYDRPRSGHPLEITDDAVAWMIDLADLGYAQELWTLKNLHQHIQAECRGGGFSKACQDHKAYGAKNFEQVRDQTIQDQILL